VSKDEKSRLFGGDHFSVHPHIEGPFVTYRIKDEDSGEDIDVPYFHPGTANRSAKRREKERKKELGE
jgi:hypothetical protein